DLAGAQLGRQPAEDLPGAQLDVQIVDAHQGGGHFSSVASFRRFSRILRTYQPASSSSAFAVSSGSTSTRTTSSFFAASSRLRTEAAVSLGYCGSAAMTWAFSLRP